MGREGSLRSKRCPTLSTQNLMLPDRHCPPILPVHTRLLTVHRRVRKGSLPPAQVPPAFHLSSSGEAGSLRRWSHMASIHSHESRSTLHIAAPLTVDRGHCHPLKAQLVEVLGPPLTLPVTEIASWVTNLSSSFWPHSWTRFFSPFFRAWDNAAGPFPMGLEYEMCHFQA